MWYFTSASKLINDLIINIHFLFKYFIQQPTLSDMTDYELNFSLKIEEMLSGIADPAYRCLVVEVE